ncbi:MAG TPA: glycosyltransferase [Chloroflexota bacterium]|nr:glycosyltransferase [Chloroflexota bacterium]
MITLRPRWPAGKERTPHAWSAWHPGRPVWLGRDMAWPAAGLGLAVAALIWLSAADLGAWAALGVLLLGAAFVARSGVERRAATLYLLAGFVTVSAVEYLTWRFAMIDWVAWWIALPLYAAELFGALHIVGLQVTVWPRQGPRLLEVEDPTWRPVFIFIPTVNEGVAVLEATVRGAQAARRRYLRRHRHARVEIVICNDGRVAGAPGWLATERLARRLRVRCITRTEGGGAKAGNIEHARQEVGATGATLLAIFDADQVPEPTFLTETIPPFADPSIGWVQTGQYYRNTENPVARWAGDQQQLFYQVLCPGKAALNSAFICGTNVVLRAAALDEIGGLPRDSVTEDFMASIELHPRWRSVFVSGVLARGLGPMDLRAYFRQQQRWATGTLGVLRSHWRPIILGQRKRGLSLPQRVQYGLACTHYLCGLRDLIYIVAPLAFLITGLPAVRGATLAAFLEHFLPYWLASQLAFWYVARGKSTWRGIVIGFASFPVLLVALATVALGRRGTFTVTPKLRGLNRSISALVPHMIAAAACLAGLGLAASRGLHRAPVTVSALWVAYTLVMLGGVMWLALAAEAPAVVRAWGSAWREAVAAFRPVRKPLPLASLIAVTLLGTACLRLSPNIFATQPLVFVPGRAQGHPQLGISLSNGEPLSRPAQLAQQLGAPFTIVGRTQDLTDRFDTPWATALAAHGGTPWITLLFAPAKGEPLLDSSLPAIGNGLHDAAITRWADEIRNYGRPVYLTVLPHVDRNWSISSAVTNGGIPQDVPRTWEHIQSLFQREGAHNVAWVWAPADPASDEQYAPPSSSINVVLLSLISYPGTHWAKPQPAVAAVLRRHPGKPLLLEVSADGNPAAKAAWLEQVGRTVGQDNGVMGLVYHEGSPADHPSATDNQAWSMASDAAVFRSMRSAVALAGINIGG